MGQSIDRGGNRAVLGTRKLPCNTVEGLAKYRAIFRAFLEKSSAQIRGWGVPG